MKDLTLLGLSWRKDPGAQFGWHPILMISTIVTGVYYIFMIMFAPYTYDVYYGYSCFL